MMRIIIITVVPRMVAHLQMSNGYGPKLASTVA